MSTKKTNLIYDELIKYYPDAKCELNYTNLYELIIAVSLSAQTTDKRVNIVTPNLFEKYPTVYELANASLNEVSEIISSLGLFRTKAKNIVLLAQKVRDEFNGEIPSDFNKLITLPGVGRKTANVVLGEGYKIPAIAVDTHVARVSKRLGLSKSNDVNVIEEDLKKQFEKDKWIKTHHLLLLFGRYKCMARNPLCDGCPFVSFCQEKTK